MILLFPPARNAQASDNFPCLQNRQATGEEIKIGIARHRLSKNPISLAQAKQGISWCPKSTRGLRLAGGHVCQQIAHRVHAGQSEGVTATVRNDHGDSDPQTLRLCYRTRHYPLGINER